ncbi:polysaccharide synthesis protein GtrA [Anaerosporomusa subterranea]|uniref:Polysaccharide synthesis protein GtrA n=1 Tax=Anaerosporomusa subterranea TaxID=1794912 RepID=A0A154BR57_ANASB|nr:GtrA family protein [Anaerosporomusa subterranea]KYZ76411.1 polysaccharide synthesis protein GtrA [Anaerosporomusa subterranea]
MLKEFVKFSLVGASGTLVNLAIYSLAIYLGTNYMAAATISFLVAVTNNFYWNFIWTFKGKAPEKSIRWKYVSFFLISVLNFGINLIALKYLVDVYMLNKILAQILAIGVASVFNFLLNYLITFR